jgi:hypothetical protein
MATLNQKKGPGMLIHQRSSCSSSLKTLVQQGKHLLWVVDVLFFQPTDHHTYGKKERRKGLALRKTRRKRRKKKKRRRKEHDLPPVPVESSKTFSFTEGSSLIRSVISSL